MSIQKLNSSIFKQQALHDIIHTFKQQNSDANRDFLKRSVSELYPETVNETEKQQNILKLDRNYQNVHPLLGWYKADLETGQFSYDQFQTLMSVENEEQLLDFLVEVKLLAKDRPCLLCGGMMRRKKDGKHFFWICTRRVRGVKCNRGKKSIRDGTIFDNSNLSTQNILTITWHFVHNLDENSAQIIQIFHRKTTRQ